MTIAVYFEQESNSVFFEDTFIGNQFLNSLLATAGTVVNTVTVVDITKSGGSFDFTNLENVLYTDFVKEDGTPAGGNCSGSS